MRVGTLVVMAAVLVGAAACSGGDDASTTTTASVAAAGPDAATSTSDAAVPTSSSSGAPSVPATTVAAVNGRPVRIPTSSIANGEQALLHLQLDYDPDTGCIFSGGSLLVWPPGYTISSDPLGVRDAQGNVVATVGGPVYEIGGGEHDDRSLEDQSFADCAEVAGGSILLVGEPQPPDLNFARPRPSAACGQDASQPGERMVTGIEGAGAGRYLEYLPSVYEGTVPLSLVIDLHGYGEPIEIHREMSNMIAKGEEKWFVVVLPQADHPVPRWDATIGSEDTAFLAAVLDRVTTEHCIDLARVYVSGLSNGAFMASVLACQFPDRIAAIAPVAGLQDPAGCQIDDPMPLISFHGTADTFVSYDGGLGASVADLPTDDGGTVGTAIVGGDGPSVEDNAAAWAARNGCTSASPTVDAISDEVDRLAYVVDCPSNGPVVLYRVNGGGHAWPGSVFSQSIEQIVGHTTMTIDATDLIWQFFDAHPRR